MSENERVTVDLDEECYYLDGEFWVSWDKYGEHMADEINDLLNEQEETINELKERNQRQYNRLKEITDLMTKRDWKTLGNIADEWEKQEELLQAEYGSYGDNV